METILSKYGFQKQLRDAKHEIEQNRHNSLTTTYHLTLKRFIRQGGKSIADITKYNPDRIAALITEKQNEYTPQLT